MHHLNSNGFRPAHSAPPSPTSQTRALGPRTAPSSPASQTRSLATKTGTPSPESANRSILYSTPDCSPSPENGSAAVVPLPSPSPGLPPVHPKPSALFRNSDFIASFPPPLPPARQTKTREVLSDEDKCEFKSLGTRKPWLCGKINPEEKNAAFKTALDSVNYILSVNHTWSVPALVAKLYSCTDNTTQAEIKMLPVELEMLESIREVLRFNVEIKSDNTLSKLGTKILALFAIVHERECLNEDGQLNIEKTKTTIKSFFKAQSVKSLKISTEILQKMRFNNDTQRLEFSDASDKQISHSFTRAKLNSLGNCQRLYLNHQTMEERVQDKPIDFSVFPAPFPASVLDEQIEVAFGKSGEDLPSLIYRLMQYGACQFRKSSRFSDKTKFQPFFKHFPIMSLNDPNFISREIQFTPSKIKFVFLTQPQSSHVYQLFFMLDLFHGMSCAGTDYMLLPSLYTAELVRFWQENKNKKNEEDFSLREDYPNQVEKNAWGVGWDAMKYVMALQVNLLASKSSHRPKFNRMMADFSHHLCLIGNPADSVGHYRQGVITQKLFVVLAGATNPHLVQGQDAVAEVQAKVVTLKEMIEQEKTAAQGEVASGQGEVSPMQSSRSNEAALNVLMKELDDLKSKQKQRMMFYIEQKFQQEVLCSREAFESEFPFISANIAQSPINHEKRISRVYNASAYPILEALCNRGKFVLVPNMLERQHYHLESVFPGEIGIHAGESLKNRRTEDVGELLLNGENNMYVVKGRPRISPA